MKKKPFRSSSGGGHTSCAVTKQHCTSVLLLALTEFFPKGEWELGVFSMWMLYFSCFFCVLFYFNVHCRLNIFAVIF